MRFEHIIEINDPARPDLPMLEQDQLWRGLLLRITDPQRFLPGLESAQVTDLGGGIFARTLDFGAVKIEDQITVEDPCALKIDVLAPRQYEGTRLVIYPEAADDQRLRVRFVYQSPPKGYGSEFSSEERQVLENAWLQADRDSITLIRRYAAEGLLD